MMRYGALAIAERVVVNTKTGSSVEGILWEERRGILVLRDARLIREGRSLPVDGEVYIDRAEVEFVQKPGTVG